MPTQNIILTLSGCAILMGLVIWIVLPVFLILDPLRHITVPHAIARTMIDNTTFAEELLHRRLMDASDKESERVGKLREYVIDSMILQHQHVDERVAIAATSENLNP